MLFKNIKVVTGEDKRMTTPDQKRQTATITQYNFWSQIIFLIRGIIGKMDV